jgi:2,3-bisphosphoglycerate-dependent phosphoglycerate mutase
MSKIILARHGETLWEQENRYLSWADVPLVNARESLQHMGNLLLNQRLHVDIMLTSVLERSIVSGWTVLNNMYHSWIPEIHDWRLNPRHYGKIQGLTHQEALLQYPEIQNIISSWDKKPEAVDISDNRHPSYDRRYTDIASELLPTTESLEDVAKRVNSFIEDTVLPLLKAEKDIFIVAHNDSIKIFLQYFNKLSIEDTLKIDLALAQTMLLDYNANTGEVLESRLQ